MASSKGQSKGTAKPSGSRTTANASWVARHLNTSPQTVGRLIEEGRLRAYKLRESGPWHILLDSVHEYEKKLANKYGLDAP